MTTNINLDIIDSKKVMTPLVKMKVTMMMTTKISCKKNWKIFLKRRLTNIMSQETEKQL